MFGRVFDFFLNYFKRKSIKKSIISGKRLCLCRLNIGFLRDYFEYSRSENVNKYTCISRDDSLFGAFFSLLAIIKRTRLEKGYKAFAVVNFSDKKLIGIITLERVFESFVPALNGKPEKIVNTAEIGYSINSAYWNRGFGFEALELFISYIKAWLKIKSFYARSVIENTASMRLLSKAGFVSCDEKSTINIRGREHILAIFRRFDD